MPSDYRILVSRTAERTAAEFYPFNLRDLIPRFRLPLTSGDEEPIVDLGRALDQVREETALDLAIDYTQLPIPPVSELGYAWIQTLSRA